VATEVTPGAVWLITGAQASGKSTVADLLAHEFPRGVHLRGGQFYRWAVRGWVHVGEADEAEARRLLDLRYRLSADAANTYAQAGFTTVVQDNIYGADVETWLARVTAADKHLVVLRPSVDVVAERDAARTHATGKVAYRGGYTPAINDEHVAATPRDLGLWLDTSELSAEQTVAEILGREVEARVG
jgi:predicted kinase